MTNVKRYIFITLGFICVGLGIAGIILPLMPGVVFLLLAAFFFSRSSERFHQWIMNHPRFGHYIRAYYAGAKMPLRAKIVTAAMIGVSLTISLLLTLKVL